MNEWMNESAKAPLPISPSFRSFAKIRFSAFPRLNCRRVRGTEEFAWCVSEIMVISGTACLGYVLSLNNNQKYQGTCEQLLYARGFRENDIFAPTPVQLGKITFSSMEIVRLAELKIPPNARVKCCWARTVNPSLTGWDLRRVWGPVVQWLVQRFRSERLRVRSRRSATFTPSAHVRRQSLPVWPPTLNNCLYLFFSFPT